MLGVRCSVFCGELDQGDVLVVRMTVVRRGFVDWRDWRAWEKRMW